MAAVYILISNCKDLYLVYGYFQTLAFTCFASCLITPEFFIFFIYFLGFIWMARFYDSNGGIGVVDYLKIYAHRYFKLAPMYYLVFFFTWQLYPLLSSKPGWVSSTKFSKNCNNEWPFVLTFLNNFFPFFTRSLEGCYYWAYVIPNDMILHIFFPMFIIIYKKKNTIFWILMTFFFLLGFVINGYIVIYNKFTVGILTFEDYYLFSYLYNKPYTKLHILVSGMVMGVFYLRLVAYKKLDENDQMIKHPYIYTMHTSKIFVACAYIYAFGVLNAVTMTPLEANKNGYSWNSTQNIFYLLFARFGYITSLITMIIIILTGNGNYMKWLLSLYIWRPLARLTFVVYLIFPLVISIEYFGTEKQIYSNYSRSTISMVSDIFITYFFAFIAYMLLEKPIENLKNLGHAYIFRRDKFDRIRNLKKEMRNLVADDYKMEDNYKIKTV